MGIYLFFLNGSSATNNVQHNITMEYYSYNIKKTDLAKIYSYTLNSENKVGRPSCQSPAFH